MTQTLPVPDPRFEVVRDRNTPLDVSYIYSITSLDQWLSRRAFLREQVLASAGLLPMPEKTPLNPRIVRSMDGGDHIIENVYFETIAGFYATGNLYRPKGEGPYPGVLNPHGHWQSGRFENNDLCSVPGRCINFARQGYVSFSIDMVGYNDSKQFIHNTFDLKQRLWAISPGGLQLWNSIRAIDFLQSLPYVDADRIACTGASGGGTQTFLLCAVDDRVKVAAPVNMISAHMHGGCFCENPPGLRIDTNNVEIGAMMAPRPMIMVSATGDWTKNTPEVEFPAIQHIYSLFCAEDKLEYVQIDAGHNYNQASREAVYSFFGKHLPAKPLPQPVMEQPFEVEAVKALRVFPGELPDASLDMGGIVRHLIDTAKEQFVRPEALKRALGHGLGVPESMDVSSQVLSVETDVDISTTRMVVHERCSRATIPAVAVEATDSISDKACIVVDGPEGTAFAESGHVRRLVEGGWRVVSIDCFGLGAHAAPEGSPERNIAEGFFDTYQRTDTSERVYDILAAADLFSRDVKRLALVGSGMGGPWCALAAPFADGITDVVADACGLDLTDDEVLVDKLYVPCLQRAGGFATALRLCSALRVTLHNCPASCNLPHAQAQKLRPAEIAGLLCEG